MNDYHDILKKYGLVINSLESKDKIKIITTSDNKYILKEKKKDKSNLFSYLYSRNFNYFPKLYNNDQSDQYEIFDYITDISMPNQEKGQDIILLIALLHNKTSFYKKVDIDDFKIVYESIKAKINDTRMHYERLNELFDNEIYMSPSNYLLARNISKIYSSLNYCNYELNNWYKLVKDKDRVRVATIHNNLKLDHLLKNNEPYLISWDHSLIDSPIYDLYNFYKSEYNNLEFNELFYLYEKKYPLTEDERKLLFILISLPEKYEKSTNEYLNTKKVNEIINYLYTTDKVISPYYAKEKKEEYQ